MTVGSAKPDINEVPEVRYRNRWDSPAMYFDNGHGFAMPGTYYFAISVGLNDDLPGVPIPIRFSFAVNGTPQPAPALAPGATPSPTASAEPGAPGQHGPLLPLVGGVLVAAVLGGGGWYWLRKRKAAQ